MDTSGEDTKSGVDAEEAVTLAQHILSSCPNLKLKGALWNGQDLGGGWWCEGG